MALRELIAQDVNGDPFVDGGNINITSGSTTPLIFEDLDGQLGAPVAGEGVSLDGGTTFLSYEFLGFGDVRGDPNATGGFIRVDMGDGTFLTFAIDMNEDGDAAPTLLNGNTKLTVNDLDNTTTQNWPAPACFTPGTLIETEAGRIAVEDLEPGMRIRTLDHGFQPLLAVARQEVAAAGNFAPVRFEAGTIGNSEALLVSPQHRVLISDWRAELLFGEEEVLVAAASLINDQSIRRVPGGRVTYLHLLFDQHQIVFAAGAPSESYFPGGPGPRATKAEFARLFPQIAAEAVGKDVVRPQVRSREAAVLRT